MQFLLMKADRQEENYTSDWAYLEEIQGNSDNVSVS